MKNIPDIIYLQLGDIDEKSFVEEDFNDLSEVTWCVDRLNDSDIEYSRVKNRYDPDTGSHPSETVKELMDEKGLDSNNIRRALWLEMQCNRSIEMVFWFNFLNKEIGLTLEAAIALSEIFGIPAKSWITRQYRYDLVQLKETGDE